MSTFEWDDTYSVGVASLDAQHKVLIELINKLHVIEQRGGDLSGVLDRLDWYVRHHFAFEEALMRGAGYGGLAAHIAEHREFERWLRSGRYALGVGGGEAREIGRIIGDYLKDWLTKHILIVDMNYKAVLMADSHRGASMMVLIGELTRTLEDAQDKPSREAIAKALSLARDIAACTGRENDDDAREG